MTCTPYLRTYRKEIENKFPLFVASVFLGLGSPHISTFYR